MHRWYIRYSRFLLLQAFVSCVFALLLVLFLRLFKLLVLTCYLSSATYATMRNFTKLKMKRYFILYLIVSHFHCLGFAITQRISHNYLSKEKYDCEGNDIRVYDNPTGVGVIFGFSGALADYSIYKYLFSIGNSSVFIYSLIAIFASFPFVYHLGYPISVKLSYPNLNEWRGSCENSFREPNEYFYKMYSNKSSNVGMNTQELLAKNKEIAKNQIYLDLFKNIFYTTKLNDKNLKKNLDIIKSKLGEPKLLSCEVHNLYETNQIQYSCVHYIYMLKGKEGIEEILNNQK
jgi:hypothetical protein